MAVTDTKDMTTGNPARLLLAFSMPLMLGNLFQQLYTFVDALIVGQCVSSNALAALGATEWLTFIMFGVIQGITQGCSVVIAGFFGEKQIDALKRAIYSGCLIAGVGAAGFTLAGQIAIVLDLLFVAGLDMGIAGAAYGTVLAQALAAVYCVIAIRKIEVCRIGRENRVPDRSILREQIRMGMPMGLQNIITAIGGLVVQATVNGFGILFLTGYAAANKVYVLLEIAATSYGHGILTYTAQNKGIGNDKRIRDGLFAALAIGIVTALMMSAVMVFAGQGILGLFIKETESGAGEMIRTGYRFLCVLALGFPLLYCLYVLRACIQGMGDSVMPMLSSFMQVLMRVMCALFLTRVIGNEGVFWGEVLAWVGADLFLGIVYVKKMIVNSLSLLK